MHVRSKAEHRLQSLQINLHYISQFLALLAGLGLAGLSATNSSAAPAQTVAHSLPAAVSHSTSLGSLPTTNRLNLAISLPLRNQAALTQLLQHLYDPKSPQFHHFLTPAQFAAQFGPSAADYAAVQQFARAQGLQVTATHPNRLLLDVSGSVPQVEKALHIKMHSFRHPNENRTYYAPDTAPTLNLTTPVLQISGLDNYARPQPHYVVQPLTAFFYATPNAGSGPNGTYAGYDFRNAYLPDSALTGTGQSVGLLQFDGYTPADITYYVNQAGLPAVPLKNVLLDGFNGQPSHTGGEVEVSLDIEMANAIAPGLSQIIVYMAGPAGNWHDVLNRMATDNLAHQLSCSWYIPNGPSDPTADAIFQQMAAQGQSFLNASGDDDAYTGLISFPGDSPYITQVGGTTLTTTGPQGAYVSETAWNWGSGIGTGGGISTQYPIPAWQTNISMTLNQGSKTKRNTPDVALTADNVYVRANGTTYRVGGTSCAAPLWAGLMALVNQQATASSRPPVGFLNPTLDAIGTGTTYAAAFHDITVGNNYSPSSPARFSTTASYDLCTGWGTPAGQALINALANPEPLIITPPTGFASAGRVGGPFTVTAQTLTLTNTGTNTLSWSLVNTSAWLTASPVTGTLAPRGTATTVTATLTTAASHLALGNYSTTLWFTNLNDQSGQSRVFTLSIISPPALTSQPADLSALEGQAAAFNVTATGGSPLAYQWLDNGVVITNSSTVSGAGTSNLVLSSVAAAQAGTYQVIVTNAAGAVTSAPALLTVPLSAPVFTLQPTNATFYQGQSAAFAVAVVGTTPYTYQWTFNSTNLPGATNATLTLSNLQLTQGGNYAAVASNSQGSTTSATAVLTVNPPPPCAPVGTGMVSWWTGEGNANDSVMTNNGTLVGGVGFVPGEVGQAFSLDGFSAYVSIPDSPSLNVFSTNITIELWLQINQTTPNSDWTGIVTKGNTSWRLQGTSLTNTINFAANGLSTDLSGHQNVNDGLWHHVAAVYDGTNIYIYVDGTLDASTPATGSIVQNSFPVCLGANPDAPLLYYFNGVLDEVSLYNRALSANEIELIYLTGVGGKCPVPITINTQPTNQTAYAGASVTFTAAATGSQPLNYQWSVNGNAISGATSNVFTLDNVQPTDAGAYTLTVANANSSVTSSNAVLTILTTPPFINLQPMSQTNYVGGTVTFNVVAGGTSPLNYQWSFNSTPISGATSSNLTLTALQSSQAGAYSVEVSNPYGNTNSAIAVLTVNTSPPCAPISIAMADWWQGEGNANDSEGVNNGTLVGGVSFIPGEVGQAFLFDGSSGYVSIPDSTSLDSFVTNITIELWLQVNQTTPNSDWRGIVSKGNTSWRLQGVQGSGTIDFAANGLSTDLQGTRNVNDGQWHHVAAVYDSTNIYLYIDGTLDVSTPATGLITQNSFPVCLGENPDAPLPYYFNGAEDEVTLYNRALSSQEIQTIYQAGSAGKCPVALTFYLQPTNQTAHAGDAVSFIAEATGIRPLVYQWSFNGNSIGGATNASLTLSPVQPKDAGIYAVTASNPGGTITSSNALLTVIALPPFITTQPANQTNKVGGSATFMVVAGGTQPLSYQWSYNLFNIAGATNATLTLTNVQLAQAGNYAVKISNPYGSTNSIPAMLNVLPPPPCAQISAGMAGWWAGEGNANDNISTNNGNLVGGVSFLPGEVGQALLFNGSSGYVTISNTYVFNSFKTNITIELWIQVNQTTPNADWRGIVTKGNSSWRLQGTSGGTTVTFSASPNNDLIGTVTVNDGHWHHVGAVYDGTNMYLYVDGNLDISKPANRPMATNGFPVCIGTNPDKPVPYANYFFNGAIDEVSIYNRALSGTEIQSIYAAGKSGKCPIPIVISSQPTNQTVRVGATAMLSVAADGMRPLLYQWNFYGTNLPGATNSTLILTNVQLANSGVYSVTVANPYESLTSTNALLTVASLPVITMQPAGVTNFTGTTAIFSVAANGTAPLAYQWLCNATNLMGATNTSLALTNLVIGQTGKYSVLVTNQYGTALSSNAQLVVNPSLRFVWNLIPSPRFVNTPFTVVVQAQTSTNSPATNFSSTVTIQSTNGIPILPAISGNFNQGVWTGAVTVAQTATNLVLRATDIAGDNGLANSVNVVALPGLTTVKSGNSLLLYWPISPTGFFLQSTTNLAQTSWSSVSAIPFQIGNQYLLPISLSASNEFYRLFFPGP